MSANGRAGRARALAVLITTGLLLASCRDEPEPTAPAPAAERPSAARATQGRQQWSLDDQYAALAGELPGFGGLYYDSDGRLTIRRLGVRDQAAERRAVEAFLNRSGARGSEARARHASAAASMRVQPADYDFRLLHAWRRTRVMPALASHDGVVFSAISHRKNRITIGVSSQASVAIVRSELARLRIPSRAVEVVVVGRVTNSRAMTDTLLTEYFDPVPGSVRIHRPGEICSVGFNFRRWLSDSTADTSAYFATASHCSPYQGQLDSYGSTLSQPTTLGNIHRGDEVVDPPFFFGPGCYGNDICFTGDATLYRWESNSASEMGMIASVGTGGSLVVDGRIAIDGVGESVEGYSVTKIGSKTGRTTGTIEYPCLDIKFNEFDQKWRMCVTGTTYYSEGGDSGSPVVELHGDGSTAYAIGIHFARVEFVKDLGGDTLALFSRMTDFISDVWETSNQTYLIDPTIAVVAPDPPVLPPTSPWYAIISGTSLAGVDMTCHFYGGSNIDDAAFEWIVNGNVVGTDADLYFSFGSSYTLQLHAYNSASGTHAWTTHEVSVESGAEQCYDQ